MSLFTAESALLWFLFWFGEGFLVIHWLHCKIASVIARLDRMKRWKACNRQIETCGGRNRLIETCGLTDRQIEIPGARDRQIETHGARIVSQMVMSTHWKSCNRQIETCGGRIDRLKLRASQDRQIENSWCESFPD